MAKRINKPEQLPEWFKLERYDALPLLSGRRFIAQLDNRMIIPGRHKLAGCIINELSQSVILPDIDDLLERLRSERKNGSTLNNCGIENDLPERYAVKPLTNIGLASLDRLARWRGAYGELGPKAVNRIMEYDAITYDRDRAFKSVDLDPDMPVCLPVLIGLGECTDEDIINQIKTLIPLWREQLNVPEPHRERNRPGLSILTKIIEHKAVPMMDLMLWEAYEGVRITNELMALALFPDHSKGGQHISQTNRPFVSEFMMGELMFDLSRTLDKEPHFYDWPVKDFIKWLS